jgi:hypothetical protein
LGKYVADNLVRVNRDGYTWEQFERGRRELEAALKAEGDPHPDLFHLFERLCSLYLSRDFIGRAEIRALVVERKNLGGLLRHYADCLATQINHLGVTGLPRINQET